MNTAKIQQKHCDAVEVQLDTISAHARRLSQLHTRGVVDLDEYEASWLKKKRCRARFCFGFSCSSDDGSKKPRGGCLLILAVVGLVLCAALPNLLAGLVCVLGFACATWTGPLEEEWLHDHLVQAISEHAEEFLREAQDYPTQYAEVPALHEAAQAVHGIASISSWEFDEHNVVIDGFNAKSFALLRLLYQFGSGGQVSVRDGLYAIDQAFAKWYNADY